MDLMTKYAANKPKSVSLGDPVNGGVADQGEKKIEPVVKEEKKIEEGEKPAEIPTQIDQEDEDEKEAKKIIAYFKNLGDQKPTKCQLHRRLDPGSFFFLFQNLILLAYHCAVADARNCGSALRLHAFNLGLIHLEPLDPEQPLHCGNMHIYEQTESSESDPDDPWRTTDGQTGSIINDIDGWNSVSGYHDSYVFFCSRN